MKTTGCASAESQLAACKASLKALADTQYAIGGKWRLQIIIALSDKPRRFNELQRLLNGISARVLSNELKELEQNGFLHRRVDANATPVLVEYELAEYSHSLQEVVQAMISWGVNHQAAIKLLPAISRER